MSDYCFVDGTIINPESGTARRADLRVSDGVIVGIETSVSRDDAEIVDCEGKYLSPGWMDMHVHLREPGQEHKETLETGCAAAAAGGFTAVACMPNTNPPIHTRDVVEFIRDRTAENVVDVYPIACVSKEREGETLAEMADLVAGGAVAFSDDGSPVQNSGLMRHALEYASMLDRPIINHMEDLSLNPHGHMNEGEVSTRLGLPGIPGLAEEVMIARDALLAEFTGGSVHVAHISTAGAVEIVRRAKARGINITAEVCPHHFTSTDELVETSGFDTRTKMHPPLRTAADIAAIKQGLVDGTIDAICTDHAPHASFEKEVEFIAAPFGIIGLETAWGLICRELIKPGILTLPEVLHSLIVAPRNILRLDVPVVEVGARANLTVFDDSSEWTFGLDHIKSKSKNTPYIGEQMVGIPWAVFNNGKLVPNTEFHQIA